MPKKTYRKFSQEGISERLPGREPLKNLHLRVPASFWEDLQTIADLSGLSVNAACIDLLRPLIKTKIRQLQEE